MLTRRGLLGGFGALLAAPAIVRVTSIMPVKSVPVAMRTWQWAGGFTWVDTEFDEPLRVFLHPSEIERLAKPLGLREGVDYLPYAMIPQPNDDRGTPAKNAGSFS